MIVPGIRFVQGRNDYTDGDRKKYAICIHNTSNDASDEGEAAYATRRTDGVSSHFYCDDDSVTQSIDTDDKCGHVGSAIGNENSISVEITGANAKTRQWWIDNVAWAALGRVLAQVIRHHWPDGSFKVRRATVAEMKANSKIKAFYSHNDCRLAWGGTTHTDPGPNFPWDYLFNAVNAALGSTTTDGDDMFAKYGETNDKVKSMQRSIILAGGTIGMVDGKPDYDGNYGPNTANGLKAALGYGDGKNYGPIEYADLQAKVARKQSAAVGVPGPAGPAGPQGPAGPAGPKGDAAVIASGSTLVVQ